MSIVLLTEEQLMALYLNQSLDSKIKAEVTEELLRRNPNFKESSVYQNLTHKQSMFSGRKLPVFHKILLLLLPFIFPVLLAFKITIVDRNRVVIRPYLLAVLFIPGIWTAFHTSHYLAMGEKQRWKSYWIYLCAGYVLWTIVLIIWARVYLFSDRIT